MYSSLKTGIHWLFCASMLVWLTACASGPSDADISGKVAHAINPDEQGRPLSLVIHVYQLKSRQSFDQLTSDNLNSGKSDADLLGSDLISSTEMLAIPGVALSQKLTIQPNTEFIGVVGFFRIPDPNFWRLLFSADAVRSKDLSFKVAHGYLQPVLPSQLAIPGQPRTFNLEEIKNQALKLKNQAQSTRDTVDEVNQVNTQVKNIQSTYKLFQQ